MADEHVQVKSQHSPHATKAVPSRNGGVSGDGLRPSAVPSLILGVPSSARFAPKRLSQPLRDLFFTPDPFQLGRRNRLSNFTFFVFAAGGGSGAAIIAGLLACWALISVVVGRFRWRLQPCDLPIVGTTLLFFAVMAGSDIYHGVDALGMLKSVGVLLPFVMPLFLVPRMRLSRFADTLPLAFLGAAVGGSLLIPIVLFEYAFITPRVQGFSGNPGPLSVTSLLCAGLSVLHFSAASGRRHAVLCCLGVLGASLAVILSGMRGAWPLLPMCLVIAVFARRREFVILWREASSLTRCLFVGGGTVVVLAAAVVVMPTILWRLDQMWTDLALIAANVETPTSLNLRKEMYGAAIQAIEMRPWFGYGSENHWGAVAPFINAETFRGLSFTHFHNVVLTVGVDAGIVGIAALFLMILAPLWTAWRARDSFGGARRLAAACILVVAFLGAGMTNIMLFHDILDAVFVFTLSLIAASVPARGGATSALDGAG